MVKVAPLSPEAITTYNEATQFWVELLESFTEAAELIQLAPNARTTILAQYWCAHQRFFKYLCIDAKAKELIKIACQSLKDGNCVVIGIYRY